MYTNIYVYASFQAARGCAKTQVPLSIPPLCTCAVSRGLCDTTQDTTASADERDACLLRHTTATHYCNTSTATQLLKAEKKRERVNCQGKV